MHLRPLYWMATAAVAVTLLAWWLWPHGAEAPAASVAPTADAQGRVRLTQEQERNLGIRIERSRAATDVPVTGLPAEAMPPLATSSQVTVPFAGVVTRVLVDEGEHVRRGQPLLERYWRGGCGRRARMLRRAKHRSPPMRRDGSG